MKDINKLREIWKNEKSDDKGVLFTLTTDDDPYSSVIFSAIFGSGMNLSEEDIEEGINSSIYVDRSFIQSNGIIRSTDGGDLIFNSKEKDYYTNLDSFIDGALNICGFIPPSNIDCTIEQLIQDDIIHIIQFIK